MCKAHGLIEMRKRMPVRKCGHRRIQSRTGTQLLQAGYGDCVPLCEHNKGNTICEQQD